MKQKCIYLSEEDLTVLKSLREKNGLKSDSQTISWLIRKTEQDWRELAEAVREELEKHYIQKDQIKYATRIAEQNSRVLLDAINSLLFLLNVKPDDYVPANKVAHSIVKKSRDEIKKELVHAKQKSDESKSKTMKFN